MSERNPDSGQGAELEYDAGPMLTMYTVVLRRNGVPVYEALLYADDGPAAIERGMWAAFGGVPPLDLTGLASPVRDQPKIRKYPGD